MMEELGFDWREYIEVVMLATGGSGLVRAVLCSLAFRRGCFWVGVSFFRGPYFVYISHVSQRLSPFGKLVLYQVSTFFLEIKTKVISFANIMFGLFQMFSS